MTPIIPTPTATPGITPTAAPEGEVLPVLEDGQEVAPADGRYSIVMPKYWVSGIAPTADIAYRESGGTPVDSGYAYNVTRETLPADVGSVEEYANSGRKAVEERFTDVATLSMKPVQAAGIQGVLWVYTATITADTVLIHQLFLVDGDTGFLLTGSAPADGNVRAARELFDSIAGSFSLPRG